ncbi:hypothetical protein HPB49_024393 [Dermacentor silvarum]|uniref:Uncharacterized protein n=1 Tax=Dermacentor silvarum TaxID=543639 RepID=A0ACB8DGV6_DERSI|nr:hypothetical protein HPB49_024393 [Dermacentor silvarum]
MQALWKMVAVPGLTYVNAILCLSMGVREFLERRQRDRQAGAGSAQACTRGGDTGGDAMDLLHRKRGGGKDDIRESATEASGGECRTTGDGSHHFRRQVDEMYEENGCTVSAFLVTNDLSGGGGAEAEGPNGQGNTALGVTERGSCVAESHRKKVVP